MHALPQAPPCRAPTTRHRCLLTPRRAARCTRSALPAAAPQELDLSSDAFGSNLSDAEPLPAHVVAAVASMTHLTSLDLSRRPLTERQLHELAKRLPLLRSLTIHGVPISTEQLARLERHHSAVNIHKRNSVLETMPELATLLGSLSIT